MRPPLPTTSAHAMLILESPIPIQMTIAIEIASPIIVVAPATIICIVVAVMVSPLLSSSLYQCAGSGMIKLAAATKYFF